jgi:mRNA deadenylase 3'-5' endonuclease subunit Ccr4
MYTTRRGGFDREDARLHYEQLQRDRYVLTLTTSKGETAILTYDTMAQAVAMRQAFMNTGDYCDATVKDKLC